VALLVCLLEPSKEPRVFCHNFKTLLV
jgi:hypothetical protein